MKKKRGPGRPPHPEGTTLAHRLDLRLTLDEKDAFSEAARRHHITLSEWLRLAAWQVITRNKGVVHLGDRRP